MKELQYEKQEAANLINNCQTKIIAKKRSEKLEYDGNIKSNYNVTSKRYVIDDLTEWISENYFKNAYAVTLTMKQAAFVQAENELKWGYEDLDNIKASKNLRFFLNRLNNSLYGKKATNKNPLKRKRLKSIPFFEGSIYGKTHLHYHLILQRDSNQSDIAFRNDIRNFWQNTYFGQPEIAIEPIEEFDEWLSYCTKEKSHEHFGNNIDVMNLYLGNHK